MMIGQHLRVGYSSLRGWQPLYSVINVTGLSASLACCMLLLLFVRDELSFNRHHANYDRICRVLRLSHPDGQGPFVTHGTGGGLAQAIQSELPAVEHAVRMKVGWGWIEDVETGVGFDRLFAVVDPAATEIFDIPFTAGDGHSALTEPASIVLTEESARRHFGEEDPLGRVLRVDRSMELRVTGVVADPPPNTSLRYDYLVCPPRGWAVGHGWWEGTTLWNPKWRPTQTWLLLRDGVAPSQVEKQLNAAAMRWFGAAAENEEWFVQPLSRVHLHTLGDYGIGGNVHMGLRDPGDIKEVMLYGGLGLAVLLVACINFTNLATAQALTRAREVGVRKCLGATRPQLVVDFLGRAAALVLVAGFLALMLAQLALPVFNEFMSKALTLQMGDLWPALPWLVAPTAVAALLAGGYPALYLSAFRPVEVLRGRWRASSADRTSRRGLVLFQLGVSTVLLICTLVVVSQIRFMLDRDLGFQTESPILVMGAYNRNPDLGRDPEATKTEFLRHSGVVAATMAKGIVPRPGLEEIRVEGHAGQLSMQNVGGDEDFLSVYGIDLVAGRNIQRGGEYLVNEAAARSLGWDQPLGKQFEWTESGHPGTVVGVMRDFHTASLHEPLQPVFVGTPLHYNYLVLRLRPGDLEETMLSVRQTYEHLVGEDFYGYFIDDHFRQLYFREVRLRRVLSWATGLGVAVASLGILGLATFATRQRAKEAAVRKALGAGTPRIAATLSSDYVRLSLWASALAAVPAWFLMRRWLDGFAYRIHMGPEPFILASIATLGIVIVAVGAQTLKTAMTSPAEAIRNE